MVACWNQEPNERPTAPEVLQALAEAKNGEPAVSVQGSEDEMGMEEWSLIGGGLGESMFFSWF